MTQFLGIDSVLGGVKAEGVVIKNYERFGKDKKILLAKLVTPEFKEVHAKAWGEANPTQTDFVQLLIEEYRTDARWAKAVQHLRENGQLEGTPRDIGQLIKEVPDDVLRECGDEIREKLFKHFWPQLRRGLTRGMPEWYKQQLVAAQQFTEDEFTVGARITDLTGCDV